MTHRTPRIFTYIEQVLNSVTVVLFLVICVSILAQVAARKLGGTIIWVNELSRWAFVLLVFFGTVLVAKDRHHLNVTVLLDILKPRYRLFATMVARLVMIGVSIALVYSFAQLAQSTGSMPLNTMPFVTVGFIYALCSTAFFAIAVVEVSHLWQDATDFLSGVAPTQEDN